MKKILVIAAHPDDEVLGAGGVIAKSSSDGHEVHVLIVAEGLTSRGQADKKDLSNLHGAAQKAGEILGAKSVELLTLPDNRLDSIDLLDLIKPIEERIDSLSPHTVYTHHSHDVNIDHKLIQQAVITATRPVPSQPVKELFYFEEKEKV